MKPIASIVAIAFALIFAAPAPAEAQDTDAPPSELELSFEELIEVSEVLLDVLVTDADGEVVTGLGAEDFIVEEDGEPVRLTSVNMYTTRYDEEGDAAAEIPWSRYFVLFFHNRWHTSSFGADLAKQQMKASREARRWVEEEMLPSDWVAVVSYGSNLRVHQDFTQSREALEEALKAAAVGRKPDNVPARYGPSQGQEFPVLRRHLPQGRALRQRVGNVYEALGAVAEACGWVVGRKNLMLFTIGFEKEERYDRRDAPDPEHYPELELLLNDHNVAVYPIDLSPAGRGTRQTDFLTQLAEDTGGIYYEDFIGFIRPLREVGGDNYAYYLLSYQSEHPAKEIGYQRIEVRARDEDLTVRTRRGYRYGL